MGDILILQNLAGVFEYVGGTKLSLGFVTFLPINLLQNKQQWLKQTQLTHGLQTLERNVQGYILRRSTLS